MPAAHSTRQTLVGILDVVDMLQRSRASIYRDIQRKAFPQPLKLGGSSRWLLSELEAYVEERMEARTSGSSRSGDGA